ncbi:probable E3 ubiquitin-protein ligase HERC3 isoform X2 [Asparagus officinalis]|uniref:probable E3 ubiquitin-protein ligase HERC3 isoform X2 n=1 Tax=Asparagus officinalis TaxID=4686 RepID=UPI00098E81E8|nr:probable E3 ubiquitin-protein ligase HERC3 isoform X2 [Asparagus officinalis]
MPILKRTSLLRLSLSSIRFISSSSSVYSFGDSSNGALGLSSPLLDAYEPTKIPNLPVAASHYHSLAVTTDSEVWAWGRNVEGQLGRGANSPRETWGQPTRVEGLGHVTAQTAFASGVVSSAIGDDGSLWVWGRSKRGQLGLGKGVIEAIKPSKVEALSDHKIVKVSFGWGHALALTRDGKLFGWGYCKDGRLGEMGQALCQPSENVPSADWSLDKSSMLEIAARHVELKIKEEENMPIIWEPQFVEEFSSLRVSDIACGLDHSLFISCKNTLLSCGDNTYSQLGRNTEGSKILPVNINSQPLSLSTGLGHCLSICQTRSNSSTEDSTRVFSWGWNQSSQLGRRGPEEIPAIIESLEDESIVSVSAGRVHSLALTSKGDLWAWGSGRNGRLGLGSSMDEEEPALVESLEGLRVLQAVSGFDHNLILVAD